MDKDSFKQTGWLDVRYQSAMERVKLLDTVASLGIPVNYPNYSSLRYSPQDTNLFRVDIKNNKLDYIGQPSIAGAMASSGVRFYSVEEFCRIAELDFQVAPRFPFFHVPHDGRVFPPELMESVCIPEQKFMEFHEKMRDKEIYKIIPDVQRTRSHIERFEVSRLLCDVERFIGPEEPMEKYGMGFCYEKAYDGSLIKKVTPMLFEKTKIYYDRHHDRMNSVAKKHPHLLLFDVHSFSDEIVPKEYLHERRTTPDVCIGVDPQYTPAPLVEILEKHLLRENVSFAVNYPYAGCFVPNAVLEKKNSADFIGTMIEVNKRFYCDQNGDVIEGRLLQLKNILKKVLIDCIGAV